MRVKILKAPEQKMENGGKTEYAGQSPRPSFALYTGGYPVDNLNKSVNPFATNDTLKPVNREDANIEAENGEVIVGDFDQDGGQEVMSVGGKRHSEGGTPLSVPEGAFVFSDTAKLKIKDPAILKLFGKGGNTNMTPAQLAQQYEVNKYKAIVENPDSDNLERATAQRMMDNSIRKLNELAIVQEGMKGFPDGTPTIMGTNQDGTIISKYGGKYQTGGPIGGYYDNPHETPMAPFMSAPMESSMVFDTPFNTQQPLSPEFPTEHQLFPAQPAAAPSVPIPGYADIQNVDQPTYGITGAERQAKFASMYALATTPKYSPYAAPIPQPYQVTPLLNSPEREIAAIQEQAGTQSLINAYGQNGSRQRSVGSSIQGQALTGIANAIARNSAGNVDITNRANSQNADIMTRYNLESAQRMTGLNSAGNELNQKYTDAINQRLANVSKTQQEIDKNEMYRNLTNQINPNYFYDPKTKSIRFKPGNHSLGTGSSGSAGSPGSQVASIAADLKKNNPALDNDTALKMAFQYLTKQHNSSTTNAFNPKKNSTTQSGTQNFNTGDDNSGYLSFLNSLSL